MIAMSAHASIATTQAAAHTPGPWRVGHVGTCVHDVLQIHDAAGRLLFDINHGLKSATDDQMRPNARLIAAAPEMLAALRDCLPLFEHVACGEVEDRIRAAISKAESR